MRKYLWPAWTAARALAKGNKGLSIPLLLLHAPPLRFGSAIQLVLDRLEIDSMFSTRGVRACVEDHVVGVDVHQRLAVLTGLHIEVRVGVIHTPLLVASFARLRRVLKQRLLLGEEGRAIRTVAGTILQAHNCAQDSTSAQSPWRYNCCRGRLGARPRLWALIRLCAGPHESSRKSHC
eukprot:2801900-Pleurochrysis_carterae.AAC.3